jgi:uncharacterized protein (DUF1330 family)
VLRFPSYDGQGVLRHAETYQRARQHRAGATAYFNMVLVEGVNAPV